MSTSPPEPALIRLERIAGHYGRPLRRGHEVRIRCVAPEHPGDRSAKNLALRAEADRILATCHSGGCSWQSISAALLVETGVDVRPMDGEILGRRPSPVAPAGRQKGAAKGPVSKNRSETARRIWERTVEILLDPEHPAWRWAALRSLWRPELPFPPDVRWLPAAEHRPGPCMGAGSLVAALRPFGGSELLAVQTVTVAADGTPVLDRPGGISKRTLGALSGSVLLLGELGSEPDTIHVCEGVADALALAARHPGPVIGLCGKTWPDHLSGLLGDVASVVIFHADDDRAGRDAGEAFRATINARVPGLCRAVIHKAGKDPAAAAAATGFDPLPEGWDADLDGWEELRRASAGQKSAEATERSEQIPSTPSTDTTLDTTLPDDFSDYPLCPKCGCRAPGPGLCPSGVCVRCHLWPEHMIARERASTTPAKRQSPRRPPGVETTPEQLALLGVAPQARH